ncbi:MAG: histidine--tRNA ligase [Candidatus Yonathbacteria bacterium]|nr:histidine--tRNA ligase [Candidatus Yonathbacteria bacterium]
MPKEKPKSGKKEPFASPRGMKDIIDTEYYQYQGFFEKAAEVAVYYGFKPIETPILEKEGVFTSGVGEGTDIIEKEMYTLRTKGGDHLALRPEGTASIMRSYIENGMNAWPQPVMLYYYGPFFRHENPQRGRLRQLHQFGVEMLGTPKSIADAIIIRTMLVILEEAGFKNTVLMVNSIGDKECRPAYMRELVSYYRKHINEICADCRERMKKNPLRVLDCKNPKCAPLKQGAPQSISLLCGPCRDHFKEVLEYLEAMNISYRINHHLVRGLDYYTRTVFEIIDGEEEQLEKSPEGKDDKEGGVTDKNKDEKEKEKKEVQKPEPLALASGGRFDYLAKNLGSKKDVPGVGGAIGVDRIIMSPKHKPLEPRIMKKPKVYFIQFGFEAKLKSLSIIEVLRKARIPIFQSLSKDSLGAQLSVAERLKIPFTIIFGQKEALEGTVIVRDMNTRSQDTIKIDELPEYIKKMK